MPKQINKNETGKTSPYTLNTKHCLTHPRPVGYDR